MGSKQCFGCKRILPIDQFYAHSGMKDGHLNKCIDCKRKESDDRFKIKMNDAKWADKERQRNRRRMRGKKNTKFNYNHTQKYRMNFPEKYKATIVSQRIKAKEGFHKHHWSYNEDDFLDVIELLPNDHAKAHRFLIYDPERKMFRRYDTNVLLDSKKRHEAFIKRMIKNKDD